MSAVADLRPPERGAVCVFAPVTLLTLTLERTPDDVDELHLHPGGQGVWQARMVRTLGARAVLCTPLGGETGLVIGPLLEAEGIEHPRLEQSSANAAWIHDRREGERDPLWEGTAPTLGRHDLDELYTATLAAALACGVCVVAGTHETPDVLEPEIYRRLVTDLGASDVRAIVDVTGAELEAALDGAPYLVKVSDEDLRRDGMLKGDGDAAVTRSAEKLRARGAANVLVSRAGAGALALVDDRCLTITAPELEVKDPRGAGDSMTAALGVAVARGLDWDGALQLAAAAGAVNVTRHGSGSGRADAVGQLARRVVVSDA